MTSTAYSELCGRFGTHAKVAKALGMRRETISRRCNDYLRVHNEAEFAIRYLVAHQDSRMTMEQAKVKPTAKVCIFR